MKTDLVKLTDAELCLVLNALHAAGDPESRALWRKLCAADSFIFDGYARTFDALEKAGVGKALGVSTEGSPSTEDLIVEAANPPDVELLYDILRFGRDEFRDENGLPLSNEENDRVQAWVDQLEKLLPVNAEASA